MDRPSPSSWRGSRPASGWSRRRSTTRCPAGRGDTAAARGCSWRPIAAQSSPARWAGGRARGEADLVGAMKFGFDDLRRALERASARETAARVAAGAVCRTFLSAFGITLFSHVTEIGAVAIRRRPPRWEDIPAPAEASDLRCVDRDAEAEMRGVIEAAKKAGDTLGGVFEV